MYGKLIEGVLSEAPKKLTIGDNQVWNAPPEEYLAQGWKPIVFTESPEAPEGYYYESGWEENDHEIEQTWILTELPDDAEEILNILTGDAE